MKPTQRWSPGPRAGEETSRAPGRAPQAQRTGWLGPLRSGLTRHQRTTFLIASGVSTAGSFAGLTAKGWLLLDGANNPLLLALHFALLTLPTLVVSGPAGVLTDRLGSERVLIRAQWALLAAASLGALAIPLVQGDLQDWLLLLSTLGIGIASAYELTARNKYVALLVDGPEQLGPYLASFSVVFNVGKLVGPPIGGFLLQASGPTLALALDAATYLLPILTLLWLMAPDRQREQRSGGGQAASLATAWRECGAGLRHVLRFTALACLLGFFHPGLAALMAREVLGPSPQALGIFTSLIAAGSITAGVLLQRRAVVWSERPALVLGGATLITALSQLGFGLLGNRPIAWAGLVLAYGIGAGTALLLAGTNLIIQIHAPQVLRGRMAGLGQIAFLGGGGLSGLVAASLSEAIGLADTFLVLGACGLGLALLELGRRRRLRLRSAESP